VGKYGIVAASALALLIPTLARAAGTPSAGAAGSSEEMILFQELPSVFGASKYEQKPGEAPASVSIVTADEIQKYGYRTLADILGSVRGFFTTYDRNYTYAGVRGFDRPGDYDTRILLLLDGHRVNDNVYDQASIGTESIVDVNAIERVEVIRGPSSSLYGTNAFLAVVNVISRSGRELKGGEITAEAGSYGTDRGRVAYGTRRDNGVEMFLNGSYYDSGGQRLFYKEFDNPANNDGMAVNADYDSYARFFGKVTYGNYVIEGAVSSRTKGIPTASYGTDFNDAENRTTDARGFLSLKYDKEVSPTSRLVATASYDAYRYNGTYVYSSAGSSDYGYGRWWTTELQSINTALSHQKLIYGAEYRYNTRQDQGYSNPTTTYLKHSRQSGIWALYLQDEARLGDHVILNAGVRHDGYDTFGGTTNPRLALIVSLGEATSIKFLYGKAFRAPNAYELYYNDGGFSQKSNPNLRPETIQTYEIALEHAFGSRLRGAASVYQYRIKNLINLETDPLDLLLIFENVDRVKAQGAEVEMEGKLSRSLDARASYAWQKSENELTGDTLSNSPRHMAKLGLAKAMARERFQAALELQYLGSRDTVTGGRTGSYVLTNLTLLSRNWKNGPTLSFSVYNLFDRHYGDPGGEEHVQEVIPQDGRNYRLQVKYDF